jgi:hypothetical protein
MVRDEVDLVALSLRYHLGQGLERVLVVDNGSTDGTRDELRRVGRVLPVEWTSDAGPFHQGLAFTEMAREAARRGADWVVPLDADDFWHAPGGLIAAMAQTGAGALQAPHIHFIQRRGQRTGAPEALMTMTRRVSEPVDPVAGTEAVEACELAYVEVGSPPKHLVRCGPGVEIGPGNHWVSGAPGPMERPLSLACLHAPLRCPRDLLRKVEFGRRVEARSFRTDQNESWHVRRWRRLADEHALSGEWSANSYLADHLNVYGRRRPLMLDTRLRDALAPWVRPAESRAPRARPAQSRAPRARPAQPLPEGSARSEKERSVASAAGQAAG